MYWHLGPVAFTNLSVVIIRIADQAHNHGSGHIRQLLSAEAGQIQDDYPAVSRCFEINAIDSGTEALYDQGLPEVPLAPYE